MGGETRKVKNVNILDRIFKRTFLETYKEEISFTKRSVEEVTGRMRIKFECGCERVVHYVEAMNYGDYMTIGCECGRRYRVSVSNFEDMEIEVKSVKEVKQHNG